MGLDIVGMSARENRAKMKFTVLKSETPWTTSELKLFCSALFAPVYSLSELPRVIIIDGEFSLDRICKITRDKAIEHEIVVGYENPNLPFRPPLF